MKFSEFTKKRRFTNGFYLIVGLCLLSLGAASYFAFSGISKPKTPEETLPKTEYIAPENTYTEKDSEEPEIIEETTPTNETEKEIPYNEPKAEPQISFQKPLLDGEIILKHSDTELQFSKTFSDMRIHTGIDIKAEAKTKVSACGDGTVSDIELQTPYGNIITITHKNGIISKYMGIENIKVEKNANVNLGDIIGEIGTIPNECADDFHLHFEIIKDGISVDPYKTLGLD